MIELNSLDHTPLYVTQTTLLAAAMSATNLALGICIGDILILDKGLHENKHMHGITHFIMYHNLTPFHQLHRFLLAAVTNYNGDAYGQSKLLEPVQVP